MRLSALERVIYLRHAPFLAAESEPILNSGILHLARRLFLEDVALRGIDEGAESLVNTLVPPPRRRLPWSRSDKVRMAIAPLPTDRPLCRVHFARQSFSRVQLTRLNVSSIPVLLFIKSLHSPSVLPHFSPLCPR
jgi:hypothetical protein